MNVRKTSYLCALSLGLLIGAYGSVIVGESFVGTPTYTNCGTFYGCYVYSSYVGTVYPCCCSIDSTGCENYEIDTWKCAAGGTLYKNFRWANGPFTYYYCGVAGYLGCSATS